MYANSTAVDPQSSLSAALCENIPSSEDAWGGSNVARVCDETYEATYEELTDTSDPARREELIKQLNDILIQNYYLIPLVNRGNVSAHLDTLEGVRRKRLGHQPMEHRRVAAVGGRRRADLTEED